MKIALLGSTGRVGSIVYENARHNHAIHRLIRNPARETTSDDSIIKGDVLNERNVHSIIAGCDAVISCLNTDNEDVLTRSMPLILKAMRVHGVPRIITCGTAGILNSSTEPHLYRFQSKESKRRRTAAAEDHLRSFLMLRASGLDWTVVCPTYLPDGGRLGDYRLQKDALPDGGKSISIYDTADFIYTELIDPHFAGSRVGISY
jgi:uncharacterized protein